MRRWLGLWLILLLLATSAAQAQSTHVLFPLYDNYEITNGLDVYRGLSVVQDQTVGSVPATYAGAGFRWDYTAHGSGSGVVTFVSGIDLFPTIETSGGSGGAIIEGIRFFPILPPVSAGSSIDLYVLDTYLSGLECTPGTNCLGVGDFFVLYNHSPPVGNNNNFYLYGGGGSVGSTTWESYLDHPLRLGGVDPHHTAGYFLDIAGGNLLLTGNLDVTGTALTNSNLSSCGTSPSMGTLSYDASGTFTVGTIATQCILTFATAKAQTPRCFANDQTGTAVTVQIVPTTTTLTFTTATAATISSDTIDYWCVGKH